MDWQAIGTIIALLGVIASFMLTVRGQKQEREIAESTAARAEAAARLSESYTARVVEALERMAEGSLAGVALGAQHPAPAPRVKWLMTHHGGDTYKLENVGDAPARAVTLLADPTLMGPMNVQGGPDLAAGEALTFMASRHMGTQDSTVTVDWINPDGAPAQWRYPLPARPR